MFVFFELEDIRTRDETIEDLLRKMSSGDKDAIGVLYSLIKDDIYAYALSKLRNSADAEDVLHDTFVKIYRYSSKYKPQGKPMAWIITIAMNVSRRHRELKGRHISYDESISDIEQADSSFEDAAIKNDFVRQLLKILSEDEREIVVLHAVAGMKHREIAETTGRPLATVLSKYNRAIKKLREVAQEV